jgi:riboflavin synthase
MFTGIVEGMGTVKSARDDGGKRTFRIEAPPPVEPPAVGDSIAVNGVCLTAVVVTGSTFEVEAVQETLDRTNLGALVDGDKVDLERPLRADGRFDGHIVQGHVDGVGIVRSITQEGASQRFWFDAPEGLHRYLVEKGSVTVDGISLTVSGVDAAGFEVALIPHTLEITVLGRRQVGDPVNLEVDVLAKYVERLMEERR